MLSLPGRAPSNSASPHRNTRLESLSLMLNNVQTVTLVFQSARELVPKSIFLKQTGWTPSFPSLLSSLHGFPANLCRIKSERTGSAHSARTTPVQPITRRLSLRGRVLWTNTEHALVYSRPRSKPTVGAVVRGESCSHTVSDEVLCRPISVESSPETSFLAFSYLSSGAEGFSIYTPFVMAEALLNAVPHFDDIKEYDYIKEHNDYTLSTVLSFLMCSMKRAFLFFVEDWLKEHHNSVEWRKKNFTTRKKVGMEIPSSVLDIVQLSWSH